MSEDSDIPTAFVTDPVGYILTIVAGWVVTNIVLDPARALIGLIDWGYATLSGSITYAQTLMLRRWGVVGDQILAVPGRLHMTLRASIAELGLAAPVVVTVTAVVEVVAVVTTAVVVGRLIADFVPGLGGLI